jgi:chromosome segregation ATPase
MSNPAPAPFTPPSSGSNVKIPILFGAVVALLGANIYLYTQLDSLRTEHSDFKKNVQTEISNLKENSSVSTQTARRSLNSLKDELEAARRQAQMAAGQARSEAQKHVDELKQRLSAEQARQDAVAKELKTQVSQVGEVASSTATKVGEVSTEVGAVKTEVNATKSELEKTIAELKRVNGDLGVQSGLIATNGKELSALKALGERNYFEFNLSKTKEPQKVGDIAVILKKTDPKKNKYTVEVIADDKRVEKKDKNLNEPIQFYVSKARQPYEIVVNSVKKDQISGYLAAPKVQTARN